MRQYLLITLALLICVAYAHVEVGVKHQHHSARSEENSKEHSQHRASHHNEHKISSKERHNHHVVHRHYRTHHRGVKARCDGPSCNDQNSTLTGPKAGLYDLLYNSNCSFLALTSNSNAVGIIIDYSSGIVVSLDGKSEEAVLVDPKNKKVIALDKGSPLSWAASRQSFVDFFATVNSQTLKEAEQDDNPHGHTSSIIDAPNTVQKLVAHVLAGLGEEEGSNDPIKYVVGLSKRLTKIKNVLIILIVGNGKVTTPLNLKQIVCVLEGLAQLLANCEANSAQVPKLDLADILAAHSGTEAFINILKQLGTNVDLTKVIGNGLTSVQIIFTFTVKFSAGSSSGVDGINKIIYYILQFIDGHGDPTDIGKAILQYLSSGVTIDRKQFVGIIRSLIAVIERQERLFPNTTSPSVSNFFRGLEEGNLVFNRINISSIIHDFKNLRPVNALRSIIGIFIQLGLGFPDAFLHVVRLIVISRGNPAFGRIPGLDRLQIPTTNEGFQDILRNSNFTQAISSGCPFTEALKKVPGLNIIIGVFSQFTNGTNSLNSFFGPSSPGLGNFLNIFQEIEHGDTGFQNIIKQIENGIASIIPHGVPFSLPNIATIPSLSGTTGSSSEPSESTGNSEPPHISIPLGPGPVVFPPPSEPIPIWSLPPLGPGPVIFHTTTEAPTTEAPTTDDSEIHFSDIPVGDASDGTTRGVFERNIKAQSNHLRHENKKDTKSHHH